MVRFPRVTVRGDLGWNSVAARQNDFADVNLVGIIGRSCKLRMPWDLTRKRVVVARYIVRGPRVPVAAAAELDRGLRRVVVTDKKCEQTPPSASTTSFA